MVLQRRYQTMGFRIDDPWEKELPVGEAFTAYDPINGRLVTLDGSAAQRAAHAQWMQEREASWRAQFPDPLSRMTVTPAENRLNALVRFFHTRMQARRAR